MAVTEITRYRGVGERGQRSRNILRARRWLQGGRGLCPSRRVVQRADPGCDTTALIGHVRQRIKCLLDRQLAAWGCRARDGLKAGCPIAQGLSELGHPRRRFSDAQRADRVSDPDQAVSGTGHRARQQDRPPLGEHVAPIVFGDLDLEIVQPVAEPSLIAHGVLELIGCDPGGAAGPILQLPDVAVQPAMNLLAQTQLHKRLGCHRTMVGKEPCKFGTGAMQPLVGLVEHSGPI